MSLSARRAAFATVLACYHNDFACDGLAEAKHSAEFIKRVARSGKVNEATKADPRLTSTSVGAVAVGIARQVMTSESASRSFIDIEITESAYLVTFDREANADNAVNLVKSQGDAAILAKPGDQIGEGAESALLVIAVEPTAQIAEGHVAAAKAVLAESAHALANDTFVYRDAFGPRAFDTAEHAHSTAAYLSTKSGGTAHVFALGGKHYVTTGAVHGTHLGTYRAGLRESVQEDGGSLHNRLSGALASHGFNGSHLFASPGEGWSRLHGVLDAHGLTFAPGDAPADLGDGSERHGRVYQLAHKDNPDRVVGHLHVMRVPGVGDRTGVDRNDHPMKGRHEFLSYLSTKLKESTEGYPEEHIGVSNLKPEDHKVLDDLLLKHGGMKQAVRGDGANAMLPISVPADKVAAFQADWHAHLNKQPHAGLGNYALFVESALDEALVVISHQPMHADAIAAAAKKHGATAISPYKSGDKTIVRLPDVASARKLVAATSGDGMRSQMVETAVGKIDKAIWAKAEGATKEQYGAAMRGKNPDKFYAITMSIYKKMAHIKETTVAETETAVVAEAHITPGKHLVIVGRSTLRGATSKPGNVVAQIGHAYGGKVVTAGDDLKLGLQFDDADSAEKFHALITKRGWRDAEKRVATDADAAKDNRARLGGFARKGVAQTPGTAVVGESVDASWMSDHGLAREFVTRFHALPQDKKAAFRKLIPQHLDAANHAPHFENALTTKDAEALAGEVSRARPSANALFVPLFHASHGVVGESAKAVFIHTLGENAYNRLGLDEGTRAQNALAFFLAQFGEKPQVPKAVAEVDAVIAKTRTGVLAESAGAYDKLVDDAAVALAESLSAETLAEAYAAVHGKSADAAQTARLVEAMESPETAAMWLSRIVRSRLVAEQSVSPIVADAFTNLITHIKSVTAKA